MPASTLDPVNAALRSSLARNTSDNSINSQLASSAKRALLTNIEFEPTGSYQSTVLDKLKSKYIVLQASEERIASKPTENMGADETLTVPKQTLYPIESVQLGWTSADWTVGAGMVNMGNTCYLNSTLQALFHVPALVNWLLSDKQHLSQCDNQNSGGGVCIICAMTKTLHASQQRNTNAFRPYLVYGKLRLVCRNFMPGRQEDAHEFLRYLVEAMERAYLHRFRNYTEFDSRTKETTPLNQILGGYLRSAVRCLECGHVSTTFQHFQDLLLDIRKATTLDEAMEGYFAKEKLDDLAYHCESCNKKVPATKQFFLERAPMVLCIQLKRFSISNNKITKHVQFKQRLELTRYARSRPTVPLTYRLAALVTHMGPTVGCGHYTAVAQAPSGTFYQFDDCTVRPISHQAVFGTNAYIMLYELERDQSNLSKYSSNGGNKVYKSQPQSSPSAVPQTGSAPGHNILQEKEQVAATVEKLISSPSSAHLNGSSSVNNNTTKLTAKENNSPPIVHNGNLNKNLSSSTTSSQTPLMNGSGSENHGGGSSSSSAETNSGSEGMTSDSDSEREVDTRKTGNGSSNSSSPRSSPGKQSMYGSKASASSSSSGSLPPSPSRTDSNDRTTPKQPQETASIGSSSAQPITTKLVPYEDDSSSEESTISRITTKATSEWKVSEDGNEPPTAGKCWSRGGSSSHNGNGHQGKVRLNNTTSELLRMSHSGYAAPVSSWNGNRAQLDREINNEKREERKRSLSSDNSADQGRTKHVRTNNGNSHVNKSNPGYNPVQEYHTSRQWHSNGSTYHSTSNNHRPYFNGNRHRNQRRNFHHKYHNKNSHRFRN